MKSIAILAAVACLAVSACSSNEPKDETLNLDGNAAAYTTDDADLGVNSNVTDNASSTATTVTPSATGSDAKTTTTTNAQ